MRKRSGALHSDSEEEFMLLAELSHEKTGYFYDETVNRDVNIKIHKRNNTLSQRQPVSPACNFQGFDFQPEDYYRSQQREELFLSSNTKEVNFAIVCRQVQQIKRKLNDIWPNNANLCQSQVNSHDLFICNRQQEQGMICFKFWIIEETQVDNIVVACYLKRAKQVVSIDCKLQRLGQKCTIQQLEKKSMNLMQAYE